MTTEYTYKVAHKWDSQSARTTERTNFWHFPEICGPLNVKICGKSVTGVSGGVARRLAEIGPFERAVSVGCGRGTKETALLHQDTVKHFTMYDLSPARLKEAAALQAKRGVAERADLICADAFASAPEESFDLVYWASSLHHMPDA
jgi:SAM-dependent methyltransferase